MSRNMKLVTSTTFADSFELFQIYNRARNLSEATIENYNLARHNLIAFMGGDFDLLDFTQDKLYEFIEYCRQRGNNDITINTKLRHLRAMWNYFSKQGYCPPLSIQMLKTDKPIKETYTDKELRLLLQRPNLKRCGFDDYRNWVIVNYLLGTGNRLSTVINIQVKDLNLDEDVIILRHTKNRTQQIIPIAAPLKRILMEYLKYRKPKSDTDYLFCTWHGEKLTTSGLTNGIRRYNLRRGVHKGSIHLFRHTFAKMWIMNGGDILRLQKLLGHKSLEMVKEYVALFGQDLKKDYDKFNPLSTLNTKEHIKIWT